MGEQNRRLKMGDRRHDTTVTTHTPNAGRIHPSPNIKIQHLRQSLNPATDARLGTKENPIYVRDVDEAQCEGCREDGHIIWECTKEYIFDDEWQCTTPPTITHSSPSHSPIQDCKQKVGNLQCSRIPDRFNPCPQTGMQEGYEK